MDSRDGQCEWRQRMGLHEKKRPPHQKVQGAISVLLAGKAY